MAGWTNVSKPSESSVATSVTTLAIAVQPFGLLIAITSIMGNTTSVTGASVLTGWTSISKPTASVGAWTSVTKPT
jgi:hypothetical protein